MTGSARERVRAWRKANSVSQAALGEMVGAVQTMISAIENGDRLPGRSLAFALETVTGVKATLWPKRRAA